MLPDRSALRVQPEPGLALLVGADTVIGDERQADGTTLLPWTAIPTLPRVRSCVQTIQTDVCIVKQARNGEPDRLAKLLLMALLHG